MNSGTHYLQNQVRTSQLEHITIQTVYISSAQEPHVLGGGSHADLTFIMATLTLCPPCLQL